MKEAPTAPCTNKISEQLEETVPQCVVVLESRHSKQEDAAHEKIQARRFSITPVEHHVNHNFISKQPVSSPKPSPLSGYYQSILWKCNLTSSSMCASAISWALPAPPTIFWASMIWDRTAYDRQSSESVNIFRIFIPLDWNLPTRILRRHWCSRQNLVAQ